MQKWQNNSRRNDTLSHLESLARNVLGQFPEIEDKIRIARRPFFIEFSGTPKSGKTTGATRLELFLRRNDFRVRTLAERASTCPLRRKDHMFFNIWTACTTLVQMLEALDREEQIVMVDRGLFDALCWIHWFEKTARLSSDEKKIIYEFILLNRWRELTDIVFVLKVDPKVALDREIAGQLTRRPGSIMNEDTLIQFNDSIEAVSREQGDLFRRVVRIDTSSDDPTKTVEKIAEITLECLREFLGEKILVLPKKVLEELAIRGGFVNAPDVLRQFNEAIHKSCEFVDRTRAENDLDYVQPIAVAYFQHDDKYLLLRRKEGHPKDRMHEKYVVWAGGHVREQDKRDGDPITECLFREVGEELYLKKLPEAELIGLLLDTSSIASSRHIGVVHRFILDQPDVAISMDQKEFKETKGKSVSGKFASVTELEGYFDQMEGWSKMILVEHLKLFKKSLSQQHILF
jgi:predicted NUDIX family phosphoesterase/thymidylate kinase